MTLPALNLNTLFVPILLVFSHQAWCAEPSKPDEKQPVQIEADQAETDLGKYTALYSGQVKISQGSLLITGDRAEASFPNSQLSSVVIHGQPATIQKFLTDRQDWFRGQAQHITYEDPLIIFNGQGKVKLDSGDEVIGDWIEFNTQTQQVQAKGATGSQGQPQGRVQVTLQPQD